MVVENDNDISEPVDVKQTKKYLLPGALVLVLTAVIYLVIQSGTWIDEQKITEYSVTGANISEENKFIEIAKSISFGKSKDSVLLKKVELEIEKEPYVEHCNARFSGISELELNITEKIPLAFYLEGDRLFYVDKKADILPYKSLEEYSDLIVISGIKNGDKEKIKSGIRMIKTLENYSNLWFNTSELRYKDEKIGFELIGLTGEIEIYAGSEKNISEKLKRLDIFLNNYAAGKEIAGVDYIDIRWNNRVIVKKNQN